MGASILIYCDDQTYLGRTVNSILLATPSDLIDEILVVNDTGHDLHFDAGSAPVRILTNAESLGRIRSYNHIARLATGDILVFMPSVAKPSDDWVVALMTPIIENNHVVVGPILAELDTNLWAVTSRTMSKLSWRWDLNIREILDDGKDDVVVLSGLCLAVSREWYLELGGFDEGSGAGVELEFCTRVWLCGGAVKLARSSTVATIIAVPRVDNVTAFRTAEAWMGAARTRVYDNRGMGPANIQKLHGNMAQLHRASALQTRTIDWLLDKFLPELGSIYELRGRYYYKSVGIICDGPSLDVIDKWVVQRHDLIIGVDYAALLYKCDFVLSVMLEPVRQLVMSGAYHQHQLVLPTHLLGPDDTSLVPAREVAPRATVYELGAPGAMTILANDLPFTYSGSGMVVTTAIHFAAFLGVSEIVLYGYDGKFVDGKSHTSLVPLFNNGAYWDDTASTRAKFESSNRGIEFLQRVFHSRRVSVLKLAYA